MREIDISRIVDTYKLRIAEPKFSRLAGIETIEANDWNLNIPRYVENFEEEEEINLDHLSDELNKLKQLETTIDIEISKICKELGLKIPTLD